MGSYSQLTISDYPVFNIKNNYSKDLINLIFLPSEFIQETRSNSTRNELVWGEAYKGVSGSYTFKGYSQSVGICKKRLEVFGMTIKKAKKEFPIAKKIALAEEFYDFPLSKVSFNKYLAEIADIIDKKELHYDQLYTNLREALITGELGLLGQSLICHLYSILCCVPENSILEYDLTEVIEGGYVKENDVKNISTEKILVLTEGKTDVEFISGALNKLHPALSSYYHFIDFDEYKVESNASALVKLVIALAASNIKHPIVVLFDNDTTGIMEMNKLKSISLGANFKILRLPDIQSAKKYPTIGPSGIKKMNVNGFACGIEMYLGDDVLTKKGQFLPVQWKSYNEKEGKYQGEISEKNLVQESFRQKLKSDINSDFSSIDLVLRTIFTAFE